MPRTFGWHWIFRSRGSWHSHCRRGLLTDDVAASFSHFLMSPDDAQSTKRMIEGPPLVANISVPLPDQQRLRSPTKKATQQPFRYCESSSCQPMHQYSLSLPHQSSLPLPPEPSLPSPWRKAMKDCTRQRRTANDEALLFRICFCHRQSRLPQGCVCGVALQPWRAFLHAACNVLAADRPTPGCFTVVSFATLSPKAPDKTTRGST